MPRDLGSITLIFSRKKIAEPRVRFVNFATGKLELSSNGLHKVGADENNIAEEQSADA